MGVFSFKDWEEESKDNTFSNDLENTEFKWWNTDMIEDEDWVWQIALDIVETEKEMVIIVPIAWLDIDDIEIEIKDYILSVKWERKRLPLYSEWEILVEECFFWKFARSIIMPENLDFDAINAVMENNLLVIRIPKHIHASKTIQISKHD